LENLENDGKMSEGELYKQIKKEIEDRINTALEVSESTTDFVDVKKYLDEAKKEWLLIEDYRYTEFVNTYAITIQEKARTEWFKKWFGTLEK
jgi:hypothetical protein